MGTIYKPELEKRARFYVSFGELEKLLHLPRGASIESIEISFEDAVLRKRMLVYVLSYALPPTPLDSDTPFVDSPIGKGDFGET